jgi:hypothetical protein
VTSGLASTALVAGAVFLLGWLLVRQFAGNARPALALVFAALAAGTVLVGWQALVLAEARAFSLPTLALAWAAAVGLLLALEAWRRRNGRWPAPVEARAAAPPLLDRWPAWAEGVVLGVWLLAACWLFFRPHEMVAGASDAGVYVSLSASIAQTGGILLQDDTLAALDPALSPAVLRPLPGSPVAPVYLFPGFYVVGEPPGEITPQFYPLHPVWQAVGFALASLSGSSEAAVMASLLLPGLWALLGALAVYLTVRQFAGWETAALALAGLTLCGLQIWFARYPTAETLTQFLIWSGLFAFGAWLAGERPGGLWALVAGLCFGGVFLVRVDILVLLPVFGLVGLLLLGSGRRILSEPDSLAWFLTPLAALITHSFIHAWFQSRPYFVVHSGLGLRLLEVNWLIPLVAVLAAVAGVVLIRRAASSLAAGYERTRRWAVLALIGATLVWAFYGWFVRPVLGEAVIRQDFFSQQAIPLTDHENWLRLSWYLSPVGVWLGVAGICVLIARVDRRTALMLVVGALFSALYLWNLRANPHQVYAMRRFVPVVVPFFCVAAAAFIGWVAEGRTAWRRAVAALLALIWLGGMAWSARGLVSQVDHRGLTGQLAALDATLEPGSVLLFNDQAVIGQGDYFGTPLQFVFGHDVFSLRDPAATSPSDLVKAVEFWQNSGRAVYWIGDPEPLGRLGLAADEAPRTLSSRHLEEVYDRRPTAVLADEWTLRIAKLRPSE